MANAYTGTATISGQTGITNLVQTAYDKMVGFALRSEPTFRTFVDKRPVDVDKPGSSVVLQKYSDLAPVTTALTENVDPDAVALSNTSTVSVTLYERGNAVLSTEKLALESLSAIDPAIANIVAFNMRDSIDEVISSVVNGGNQVVRNIGGTLTPVTNGSGVTTGIDAADKLTSAYVRYVVSKLRGASAMPYEGGAFVGLIHPDVSHDLRAETGAGGWRPPHEYSGATAIWAGELGLYEGVRFVESPRAAQDTDGESSAKVSRTLIMGREALVEAVGREPGVVIGPVVDKLMRTRPIGWKGLLGHAIYRQEAVWRVETGSTY